MDRSGAMKILLNVIGGIAVALAVLGIFLPLLPTVPFLLLASACFMRGSERMHRWLLNNKLFGEYIRNVESSRGIPLKAKAIAIVLTWASLSFSIYLLQPVILKALLVLIGLAVSVFIVRMKTLNATSRDRDAH